MGQAADINIPAPEDILLTRFQCYFIKMEINLKWEIIRKKKKNTGHPFFMRNQYMKFQNINKHGSKLMLCTIKQQDLMAKHCKGS